MEIVIETNRLILRKPKISDADVLLKVLSDRKIKKYTLGLYYSKLEDLISALKIYMSYDYIRDFFFVIETKDSNSIIGVIEGYSDPSNIFRVSYACKKQERGKGYITEATKAFIDHLYHNSNLNYISFSISRKNKASNKVMKKLNIKQTTSKKAYKSNFNKYLVSLKEELPF